MRPCRDAHPEPAPDACRVCWLYLNRPDYRAKWDGGPAPPPRPALTPCARLGAEPVGERDCPSCGGRRVRLKTFPCAAGHGAVAPSRDCGPGRCPDYARGAGGVTC